MPIFALPQHSMMRSSAGLTEIEGKVYLFF